MNPTDRASSEGSHGGAHASPTNPGGESAALAAHVDATHTAHLAHHFDTPAQQFSAATLGMWIFLATELLLFGGLFCVYAVYRANHREVFAWGHHFLDIKWGAANTVILLASSFTVATAVHCAQRNRQRRLALFLALTLAGGFAFMGIKFIEYRSKWQHGLLWGKRFRPDPRYVASHFGVPFEEPPAATKAPDKATVAAPPAPHVPDAARGRELFLGTCASCHGPAGQGLPGQAKDLRGSTFVAERSDEQLLEFVKIGRRPWDPLNTMKIDMPPRGGNPMLKDDDMRDIIAHVRTIQQNYQVAPTTPAGATQPTSAPADEQLVLLEQSFIKPAPPGPAGLRQDWASTGQTPHNVAPPANAHVFFGVYFLLTGLHGFHVLAGLVVLTTLLILTLRGRFSPAYFTPIALGGLYWHLVDIIWIYLFPLLYLIH